MVAELDDSAREPRSLTCHYLRPPAAGPVRIEVTVERSGRATSTLTARLLQDGRAVRARGRGVRDRRARAPPTTPRAPPAVPRARRGPARRTTARRACRSSAASSCGRRSAGRMFAGADEALTGGWLRFARARAPPTRSRSRCSPTRGSRRRGCACASRSRRRRSTCTVHFRAPRAAAALAPGEPVLAVFRSTHRRRRLLRGGRRAVDARRRPARPEPPARAARPARPGGGVSAERAGYLGLGSNVGDRRANLQAAVDALPAPRRDGARVVVDLRHRSRRPRPRPARVPQRLRPDRRPSSSPRRCSTRARRSSATSAATSRAASATGRARSTSTSCCSATELPLRAADASRTSR